MDVDVSTGPELSAEVHAAARAFAAALSETPAFRAFQRATVALRKDSGAGRTIDAYQQRAKSMRSLLILGPISHKRQAELDRLRQACEQEPSVVAYLAAQRDLGQLAQAAASQLSAQIGLNFATVGEAAAAAMQRPAGLSDAVDALAAALHASPAFAALAAAAEALCADTAATVALERFTAAQSQLHAPRMDESLAQDELGMARELEQQVQENGLISGYLAAQQEARACLAEVNRAISQLLEVDFAWLIRSSGGWGIPGAWAV